MEGGGGRGRADGWESCGPLARSCRTHQRHLEGTQRKVTAAAGCLQLNFLPATYCVEATTAGGAEGEGETFFLKAISAAEPSPMRAQLPQSLPASGGEEEKEEGEEEEGAAHPLQPRSRGAPPAPCSLPGSFAARCGAGAAPGRGGSLRSLPPARCRRPPPPLAPRLLSVPLGSASPAGSARRSHRCPRCCSGGWRSRLADSERGKGSSPRSPAASQLPRCQPVRAVPNPRLALRIQVSP